MSDDTTQQGKPPLSTMSDEELELHLASVREVAQGLQAMSLESLTATQLEQRDTMLRESTQLLERMAMEQLRRLVGGIGKKLQALIASAGHRTQEDQGGPQQ